MLQNAYFLAKIGADTAENEQHFAEILQKTGADAPRRDAPTRTAYSHSGPAFANVASRPSHVLRPHW